MTTYTSIPDTDIDVDSPITTGLMTLLRDNPIAITEKAAGAPVLANSYVVEAMLNASAVSQGKLKTTTGTVSTSGTANLTLPGGQYGFWPTLRDDQSGVGTVAADVRVYNGNLTATSTTSYIYISETGASSNCEAQQRYVQSSPPYDIGDGQMAGFVFALMNKDGSIHSTYVAQDPPWANNGPTSVFPQYHKNINGKPVGFRKVRKRAACAADVHSGKCTADDLFKYIEEEQEVTHDVKNADMAIIPHPFIGMETGGRKVVMFNPYDDFCDNLLKLHDDGESMAHVLLRGLVKVDNVEVPGKRSPKGVMIVGARFK